jgi:hypothetical protein
MTKAFANSRAHNCTRSTSPAATNCKPTVRSYRYMVINNRLLLVDPATGIVVAETD